MQFNDCSEVPQSIRWRQIKGLSWPSLYHEQQRHRGSPHSIQVYQNKNNNNKTKINKKQKQKQNNNKNPKDSFLALRRSLSIHYVG